MTSGFIVFNQTCNCISILPHIVFTQYNNINICITLCLHVDQMCTYIKSFRKSVLFLKLKISCLFWMKCIILVHTVSISISSLHNTPKISTSLFMKNVVLKFHFIIVCWEWFVAAACH